MTAPVGYGSLWVCCWPCPPALSGRACLWLSPSRPLVGSVCPQGSRTGACLLRLRLLLLLDLPLSLAGARPLGSSDKADPVAQIRTSRQRIQFVCSLCKYRTFYEDEMGSHLDSKFHKEHFKYVGTKLPKQTADFLQEYVTNKTKKTEELRKTVEDLDGLIQQIYRDQDLTQEIAMEHFVKKVEAAHCAACDLFIPMQFGIIQKHLKTMDHNRNRRLMMEQSKKSSLMVARSILNNKLISKKLERYLKGENPFTDNPEEEKEQDEVEAGALDEGAPSEATELTEGVPAQPPVPLEPAPGTTTPPPPPPPEEEESPVPLLGGALQCQIRGIPGLDMEDDEEGGGGP